MKVTIEKRSVDVIDQDCEFRPCFALGFDKGSFTQGVGYAILSGLMLAASFGWLWVAVFVVVVGPWLGWQHVRRAA